MSLPARGGCRGVGGCLLGLFVRLLSTVLPVDYEVLVVDENPGVSAGHLY
jgi:hypothetical protein